MDRYGKRNRQANSGTEKRQAYLRVTGNYIYLELFSHQFTQRFFDFWIPRDRRRFSVVWIYNKGRGLLFAP